MDDDSTDCGCSVFFGIDKRRIVKIITAVTTNGPRLYFVRNEIKQQNRANIQATVKIMDPIPAPKNITFMVSVMTLNIILKHLVASKTNVYLLLIRERNISIKLTKFTYFQACCN